GPIAGPAVPNEAGQLSVRTDAPVPDVRIGAESSRAVRPATPTGWSFVSTPLPAFASLVWVPVVPLAVIDRASLTASATYSGLLATALQFPAASLTRTFTVWLPAANAAVLIVALVPVKEVGFGGGVVVP